jgi:hypothetical protein
MILDIAVNQVLNGRSLTALVFKTLGKPLLRFCKPKVGSSSPSAGTNKLQKKQRLINDAKDTRFRRFCRRNASGTQKSVSPHQELLRAQS